MCVYVQGSPFTMSVSGLSNDKSYEFKVQLHNAAGWGEVSGFNCIKPKCEWVGAQARACLWWHPYFFTTYLSNACAVSYKLIIELSIAGGVLLLLLVSCLSYKYVVAVLAACSSWVGSTMLLMLLAPCAFGRMQVSSVCQLGLLFSKLVLPHMLSLLHVQHSLLSLLRASRAIA